MTVGLIVLTAVVAWILAATVLAFVAGGVIGRRDLLERPVRRRAPRHRPAHA